MFARLVALSVGFILVPAVLGKAQSVSSFAKTIERSGILPAAWSRPGAVGLLATEAVGCILLFLWSSPVITLATSLLFMSYAGAGVYVLVRNEIEDCGCLGPGVRLRYDWWSVGINVVVAAALSSAAALGNTEINSFETQFVLYASALVLAFSYWLSAYARSVLGGDFERGRS